MLTLILTEIGEAPGAWSKHVKKLYYAAARQGSELKTQALVNLNEIPAKRELAVRNISSFTPTSLEHTIGDNANKVQSVVGYIDGEVADLPLFLQQERQTLQEYHVPTEDDSNKGEQVSLSQKIADGLNDTIAYIEASRKKKCDPTIRPRRARHSLHNSLPMPNPAGVPSSYESATENFNKLTDKPKEQASSLCVQLDDLKKVRNPTEGIPQQQVQNRKRKSDTTLKAQRGKEPSVDGKDSNSGNREISTLDDTIRDMENNLSRQREKLQEQEGLLLCLKAYRQQLAGEGGQ
ncbi:hypothetical protein N7463_008549 [Penicillium fimorum]|uniref:Uncharacterized protein n=1 Tax=Penicillium fimorum TaxID=1882269 RepID=A0A9W9XP36_9EURO|nr:hypothetical protein N7463_008549 [Penicillium fimorum]